MFPIDQKPSSRTIFINPNFNKLPPTHINPKFLQPQKNPSIHVNPNFLPLKPIHDPRVALAQPRLEPDKLQEQNATVSHKANVNVLPNKIISKSRTKIVRMPMSTAPPTTAPCIAPTGALVKIGLRKLVRTAVSKKPQELLVTSSASRAKYKVDRRILTERNPIRTRKTSFTGRYAFRRSSDSLPKRTITRFIKRSPNALSFSKTPFKPSMTSSMNRQLQLLNINGVLYRSTRNKLERKDARKLLPPSSAPKKSLGERAIFVRGTKYLLDKTGFNLTRVATPKQPSHLKSLRRIDIGGLTYVANSKNVLVRTDTHLTRNHVSSAKQKSIHLLSKRYVKTNIPCPIFQRVGKCAAFERGKCMKVHDKRHVAICQRFLRGECLNSSCLLSHNISLSKMPVCKFFLQGCCVREDCPYLHKKLSDKAEICTDFLKGFCKLAQECNKRHEFLCPDMETKGKCEKVKCPYCRKQQKQLSKRQECQQKKDVVTKTKIRQELEPVVDVEAAPVSTRYFIGTESTELGEKQTVTESSACQSVSESEECEETEGASSVPSRRRPQLGELPAFIPLS